jgi:NAD(P)-dependent dehydrogenase (short-subunit alcohol dehydrogenase family)
MSAKKDASRRNVAAMARELAPRAMAKLEALLASESEAVAKDAAIHILDRAIGKPVAMTADVTDRLDEFDPAAIDAAINDLEARLGIVAPVESEAATPPVTH